MRNRRIIPLLISAVVLAGVFLLLLTTREREPEYGGKRLSEWVEAFVRNYLVQDTNKMEAAAAAIRSTGTRGFACMVHWMSYEEKPWKTQLHKLEEFLPDWMVWTAGRRADSASIAFRVVGPPPVGKPEPEILRQAIP